MTKIFLAAFVINFSVGSVVDFSHIFTNPAWTVAMPLGAVFFGLFLISLMLQKEMTAFDREEAEKSASVKQVMVTPAPERKVINRSIIVQMKGRTL